MANGGRGRRARNRANGRAGSQYTGGRRGDQQKGQSKNVFASLANVRDEQEDGDTMNAHLQERFGSSYLEEDTNSIPAPGPTRMNTDIYDYHEVMKKSVEGGAWLGKSEIPTSAEILVGPSGFTSGTEIINLDEQLRPNKVEGAYQDNEDYLQTQYELVREDAIRPLREAVEHVRRDPLLNESEYQKGKGRVSLGIYDPVYVTSVVFSPRGLATRVAFSLGRVKKHVRWDQSKRLITGTLVALSPADDAFQHTCVLATVAARPLFALAQNPPQIDLFFARPEEIEIDPTRKWIMVESRSSFYEASRHTLLALQHMMRESFPLSEHLVKTEKDVMPPSYVEMNPYVDMSPLVTMEESEQFQNVNILERWPSSSSHGLDKSQSKALRRILTNRLAIIQGPPGTGKTYVSVVALKILLANMRKDDPPIIVTCQTNHALDQLLRHVAEFEPNFIRLGGRSKDKDKIKKRTLFEVRCNMSQQRIPGNRKVQAIIAMTKLTSQMQMLLTPLDGDIKIPLDHKVLVNLGLITAEQAASLEMDGEYTMGIDPNTPGIQMEQWLGKCLKPCPPPTEPDEFGMEFEEEDFEVEQLQELEAEAVAQDDDEIDALKGRVTLLGDNYRGKSGGSLRTDDQIRQVLKSATDLTLIPASDRGAVYNYFKREIKRLVVAEFRKQAKQYENLVIQRKIGQWEQDHRILRDQRLIGMTTTGLSKYRGLISSLKPRIVLVEEAAETLEAPVTAACLPSLEHLVLVGDHQQLRPHCQVRELEEDPYNFNLSLFERMVLNDVAMDCLTRQRRMIPEVRRLLEPIYGSTLKDHPNVSDASNRPPVEGMGGCNSFFFTHEWPESKDANMSAFNDREAAMIVGFFDYLVLNDIDPSKITILTFYHGQRKRILRRLRDHPNLRAEPVLNVVTVDSYQGEENDIVLLSLVRSNKGGNIGFLEVDNRVCVALSRAKRGFYIFGNAEMLACESETWAQVVKIMCGHGKAKDLPTTGQQRRVGYQFPLECVKHGNKTWIEEPSDWELLNGGCDELCRCLLPCGHTCMLRCHPFENTRINCTQKCSKRVDQCRHPCIAMCCDPCRCQVCDRRHNGMKAMLKPAPANGTSSFGRNQQDSLLDTTFFSAPAAPPAPSMATEGSCSGSGSGSTRKQWKAYTNGGAKADDAQMLQKAKEEDAKFYEMASVPGQSTTPVPLPRSAKLIEVSPKKRNIAQQPSMNTDLLLDLAMPVALSTPEPKQRLRYNEQFSPVAAAMENAPVNSQKQTPAVCYNLLD